MSMMRWDPMRDLQRLRDDMNRFIEEGFGRSEMAGESFSSFPVDVSRTENEIKVKAAIPGMKPEGIRVEITGNMLTITGERKEEQEKKEENYITREMRIGRFQRQIMLPADVNTENAQANFENGILNLTIPIAEQAKPKQIRVQQAEQKAMPQQTQQPTQPPSWQEPSSGYGSQGPSSTM